MSNRDNKEDREILRQIAKLYWRRKQYEGLILDAFADEIGISLSALHNAIKNKLAGEKVMKAIRDYLEKKEAFQKL